MDKEYHLDRYFDFSQYSEDFFEEEGHQDILDDYKEYLEEFTLELEKSLKPKTIARHLFNVSFYLIDYCLFYSGDDLEGSLSLGNLDDFFGRWYQYKCMWSTPTSVKQTIAGLKKFYKVMLAHGHIDKEHYDDFIDTIKEYKDDWAIAMGEFNTPKDDFWW